MCRGVLPAHMSYTICLPGAHKDRRRGHWIFWNWIVISCHVGSGTWTLALWKSNQVS